MKEQIEEWTENPVTLELLKLVNDRIKELRESPIEDFYRAFDAHRTQETMAAILGSLGTLEDIADQLKGDWSSFEEIVEEDNEE